MNEADQSRVDALQETRWQRAASAAAKRHIQGLLSDPAPTVESMDDDKPLNLATEEYNAILPTADEFMDPAPIVGRYVAQYGRPGSEVKSLVPTADEFMDPSVPDVEVNVSGQPPARRDHMDRYIVVDPQLGDFRRFKNGNPQGLTRATTFNKAAQNTTSLNAWGKRNVVMGASLRPDVLRRAHGLKHETDKNELDQIVRELETAAGAKISADEGTYLHEFTEKIDAGLLTPDDAPKAYRADLERYVEALAHHGLEPVPGLIERTTMISEFGGVVGTFDRIFFHRPSGTYVVGDLKTGKTMEYALEETETQIWTYAHGVNQNGVYDWNTDTWRPVAHDAGVPNSMPPLVKVREDVGVIVHMPVQGPLRGDVYVLKADLVAGAEHAKLCHTIRSRAKRKVTPFEAPGVIDFSVIDPTPWDVLFSQADTNERASELWKRAKEAGIKGVRLNELVALAQHAIKVRG